MKKILIAGKGSYIGESFRLYAEAFPDDYAVDVLDTMQFAADEHDFHGYDAILFVAGIAHMKENAENAHLYYEINRDLAVQVATKAKNEGVPHFVYLSSMSVYGKDSGVITPTTLPDPKSNYGKSKMQAETQLFALQDDTFKVAALRPPMVYGKDCKGNFQTIVKLIEKLPIFPHVKNKRSMIYIDNLCAFMRLCVDEEKTGVFFPQNKEYMCTTDMARILAQEKGKKVFFSRLLGLPVYLVRGFVSMANKAFGDLIYQDTEVDGFRYCIVNEEESVKKSV